MNIREPKYIREARQQIPIGHYLLTDADEIQPSDLVWSWTSKEWLPAGSMLWLRSPLSDRIEDLVCAVRKAGFSDFENAVPTKRVFTLNKTMPYECKKCGKETMWLKHKETGKPAPIEAEPNENGNILVKGDLYRMATKEEIETARAKGIPLYINHFATCEFAKSFAKGK